MDITCTKSVRCRIIWYYPSNGLSIDWTDNIYCSQFSSFIPPTHTTPTLITYTNIYNIYNIFISNVGVVCVGGIKLGKLGTVFQ